MKIGARITRLDDLTDEDVDAWRDLAARAVEVAATLGSRARRHRAARDPAIA